MEIGIHEIIMIAVIIYYAYVIDRIYFRKGKNGGQGYAKKDENKKTQETDLGEEKEQDPYKILNVGRNATRNDLTSAYRKLVKLYHPDKIAGLAPEYREIAERKTKMINAAYRKLTETIKR